MNQLSLNFEAKARRSDPVQSYIAADSKNASGTLSADRMTVLDAVNTFPSHTAKWYDLTSFCCTDGKAHRRAPELEALGLITRDRTGSEMRLYITEKGKNLLKKT